MKTDIHYEAWYSCPAQHIKITAIVETDRELTTDERFHATDRLQWIANNIRKTDVANDPNHIAMLANEEKEILACFDPGLYFEKVKNPYWPDDYKLGYLVTTKRGPIKIHWRKRVLEINWAGTNINQYSTGLFKDEDVTKSEKLIHAHSYEDAKRYINILMNA